jgi:hypothetical protein
VCKLRLCQSSRKRFVNLRSSVVNIQAHRVQEIDRHPLRNRILLGRSLSCRRPFRRLGLHQRGHMLSLSQHVRCWGPGKDRFRGAQLVAILSHFDLTIVHIYSGQMHSSFVYLTMLGSETAQDFWLADHTCALIDCNHQLYKPSLKIMLGGSTLARVANQSQIIYIDLSLLSTTFSTARPK